jgi:hypothetical protein
MSGLAKAPIERNAPSANRPWALSDEADARIASNIRQDFWKSADSLCESLVYKSVSGVEFEQQFMKLQRVAFRSGAKTALSMASAKEMLVRLVIVRPSSVL